MPGVFQIGILLSKEVSIELTFLMARVQSMWCLPIQKNSPVWSLPIQENAPDTESSYSEEFPYSESAIWKNL